MNKTDERYGAYTGILWDELKTAMGCTEPIAVAYACAVARETLGTLPQQVDLRVSGNIIKNVKSVVVPNTGVRRGLEAGLMGYDMYKTGHEFVGGDGIVTKGVENTLINVGRLGSDGMRETDKEILHIRVGD